MTQKFDWQSLLTYAPDMILTLDRAGKILFINRTEPGFTPQQVKGTSAYDYISPEHHENLRNALERVIETGRIDKYEMTRVMLDGSTVWYMTYIGPIKENNRVVALFLIVRDITESKKINLALRESENRMAHMLAHSPSILYSGTIEDDNFNPTFVSDNIRNVFGYDCEECLNDPQWWSHRIHPDDREKTSTWFSSLIEKNHHRHEYRFLLKDGRYVWVEDTLRLYRDDRGDPSYVVGTWIDITERKLTEKALRESELLYRDLVNTSPDSVAVTNLEGRLIHVSQKSLEMYGFESESEILGVSALELFAPEDRKRAQRNIERTLTEGFVKDIRYTFVRRDGSRFIGELNASLICDTDGIPKAFIATTRDVTERVRVEEELKNSREQLRQLTAHLQSIREGERTSIAREIHDELGQVLTALKMDLAWLEKKLSKGQGTLKEKVRSISKLTDDSIKTVKRISTELRPGLLDDLGLVAAVEWQAEEFQNRTKIDCDLTIEPEEFTVDDERATTIFRILQEAMTNVTRHAEASRVEVTLCMNARSIILKVSDNGKGIVPRHINSPRSFGLTGMRERCHFFGGEIKITGKRGEGTTVEAIIPLPWND